MKKISVLLLFIVATTMLSIATVSATTTTNCVYSGRWYQQFKTCTTIIEEKVLGTDNCYDIQKTIIKEMYVKYYRQNWKLYATEKSVQYISTSECIVPIVEEGGDDISLPIANDPASGGVVEDGDEIILTPIANDP